MRELGTWHLAPGELLRVWEEGRERRPVEKALALLAALGPEPAQALARLPLGERDTRLLELYADRWGGRLELEVRCPECGERLELELEAADLLAAEAGPATPAGPLRPITSADLLALDSKADPEATRRELAARILPEAVELTRARLEDLAQALAKLDPRAEILLGCACPACGHRWRAPLDVIAVVWQKLDLEARKLLGEVHTLAAAYGWSEPQILALSAARRAFYLERVAP